MCGIVGYTGNREATPILLDGLARLEYRGYDSSGIVLIDNGELMVRKRQGKVGALRSSLEKSGVKGFIGLGHTRWAHPWRSQRAKRPSPCGQRKSDCPDP